MLASDKDLRFERIRSPAPRKLTAKQIDAYNRYGFARPFSVYSTTEINAIRAYIDSLIFAMEENGFYGINCYQARLSSLWDIATKLGMCSR